MIRILTNYNCNLGCKYCFEQHLWHNKEMLTVDELKQILDFVGPGQEIQILGGEPTQHPHFLELTKVLEAYGNQNYLLTNAIFHPSYRDAIIDTFKTTLVNLNDPRNYSTTNWNILEDNLRLLASDTGGTKIQLGVNLYDKTQRFEYLIPFLETFYLLKEIRVALANPNYCFTNKYLDIHFFKEIKDVFIALVSMATFYDYAVLLDCPMIPCMFDSTEFEVIAKHIADLKFSDCKGGFTFYPGLKIGHCFSSFPDLYNLKDFKNTDEIYTKILNKEDQLDEFYPFKKCNTCLFKTNRVCQGGCLAYKLKRLK